MPARVSVNHQPRAMHRPQHPHTGLHGRRRHLAKVIFRHPNVTPPPIPASTSSGRAAGNCRNCPRLHRHRITPVTLDKQRFFRVYRKSALRRVQMVIGDAVIGSPAEPVVEQYARYVICTGAGFIPEDAQPAAAPMCIVKSTRMSMRSRRIISATTSSEAPTVDRQWSAAQPAAPSRCPPR